MYRVSVIIPTFNRSLLLQRAMESVLNQTWKDFELIVVDDASYDDTRETVKRLSQNRPFIKYIRHKENLDVGEARNTGIKSSSAPLIAFLDDDDEWLPSKLEKQMRYLESLSDPRVGMVYTGAVWINPKTGKKLIHQRPNHTGWIYEDLLKRNVIVAGASSCLIKRRCFAKIGYFKPRQCYEDWDLWLRLAKEFKIEAVDEFLVKYYQYPLHFSQNAAKNIVARNEIFKTFFVDLNKRPSIMAHFIYDTGLLYCRFNYMNLAKRCFRKALKLDSKKRRYKIALLLCFFGFRVFNFMTKLNIFLNSLHFGKRIRFVANES